MTPSFAIIAFLILASAIAAMSLRNLVHCALCLVVTFVGIAGLFLQLNAEFVGFAQILVYVGAVMILIVFAILLTRGSEPAAAQVFSRATWVGVLLAVLACLTICGAVLTAPGVAHGVSAPEVSVRAIGERLMREYVLPLEAIGLLLTAAMIGAVIVAMEDKRK